MTTRSNYRQGFLLSVEPSKIVYLAEIIPPHLRWRVLPVLRLFAPYLPVAITRPWYPQTHRRVVTMSLSQPQDTAPDLPIAASGRGWPTGVLPVEVFEIIAEMLSRDDLLRMRLVNHEFEKKISGRIFRSVVVPFQPDIYGMSETETARIALRRKEVLGNGTPPSFL